MLVSLITNFLVTFISSAPDLTAVTVLWEAAAIWPAVHTAVSAAFCDRRLPVHLLLSFRSPWRSLTKED